jgi:hypothetical protein
MMSHSHGSGLDHVASFRMVRRCNARYHCAAHSRNVFAFHGKRLLATVSGYERSGQRCGATDVHRPCSQVLANGTVIVASRSDLDPTVRVRARSVCVHGRSLIHLMPR